MKFGFKFDKPLMCFNFRVYSDGDVILLGEVWSESSDTAKHCVTQKVLRMFEKLHPDEFWVELM